MDLQAAPTVAMELLRGATIQIGVANVPAIVQDWIMSNPGQSALLIINGVLFFTPAALSAPLLGSMGFGASGPVAGTVAARLQSMVGNVGAYSMFAYAQSARMGGYGATAVNGLVQAWAVASTMVVALSSYLEQ